MNPILSVKLDRFQAKIAPFEKFYLAEKEQLPVLRVAFPYLFVFEASWLLEQWGDAQVHYISRRHTYREDTELEKKSTRTQRLRDAVDANKTLCVVPVTARIYNGNMRFTYLGNAKFVRAHLQSVRAILPESAYLLTPRGKITDWCSYCSNSLSHLQGDCTFGEPKCMKLLSLKTELLETQDASL